MNKVASAPTERLLRLSSLPGVGVSALRKILDLLRSVNGANLSDEELQAAVLRSSSARPGKQNSDAWREVLSRCAIENIDVLSPLDPFYPPMLNTIEDYPPIIYVKGDKAALLKQSAAVVGTREASRLGLSWAKQIAGILSRYEISVVSGLALGIDTAAHEGALKANGATVAILAHGLDQVTPASNRPLAKAILDCGGALVAEHPPGVPPRRAEYVRRNRIQSGMSVCSIVVESGESGGAIHQGNFTARQGRVLLCALPDANVPGASEFNSAGAKRLMAEVNAIPLRSGAELIELIAHGALSSRSRAPITPTAQHSFL